MLPGRAIEEFELAQTPAQNLRLQCEGHALALLAGTSVMAGVRSVSIADDHFTGADIFGEAKLLYLQQALGAENDGIFGVCMQRKADGLCAMESLDTNLKVRPEPEGILHRSVAQG